MKLTSNQLNGLTEVARLAPIGSTGVRVTAKGPLSGTTQNSLRDHGLVRISDDGRHRWVVITEKGVEHLRTVPLLW